MLSHLTNGMAAVWPANAILFSVLLTARPEAHRFHLFACFLAGMLANLLDGTGLALSTVFALSNVLSAGTAFRLMRFRSVSGAVFEAPGEVAWFLGSATIGVCAGATLASGALWIETGDFGAAWFSWAASDLLGMILITPLILKGLQERRGLRHIAQQLRQDRPQWMLLPVLVVTVIAFKQTSLPLLFVPFAIVLIATYRLGLVGAVAGILIVAGIGSTLITGGEGQFSLVGGSIARRVEFFQFYLVTLYGTCMPLAALLSERARLASERAESDRRHRRILDRSREVIFETDVPGRWTYLNPAWNALTGHTIEDSLGRSFLSLVDQRDRPIALGRLAKLHGKEVEECRQDLRYVHADGRVLWASVHSRLILDEAGTVVGTYGTIHDVTGRVVAQQAQTESERLYRLLADHSNDMIVHFNAQGVRQYVSPASAVLLGFTPEELIGQPAAGAIHPEDRAAVLATCGSLLKGAENPICSYRQLHKDGGYVWLEASYRLVRDEVTGHPAGFIASVRDVGRRAHAELERTMAAAKLEEANRLLLLAEQMSGVGHWRLDLASGQAFWSDMVCAIHGRPPGYAPSLDQGLDAYHPDDRARLEQAVNDAASHGLPYRLNARIVRTDGAIRHVLMEGRCEVGPSGSVTALLGVFQDVTEAHEAQAALIAASERLADSNRMLTMAESVAQLGHWRVDDIGGSYHWSDEVYRIYALDRSFVPTFTNTLKLCHPDDRARVSAVVRKAVASGSSYSFRSRIVRPDGSVAHVFVRGEVDRSDSGETIGLFGILQDISDQAQAEELLRAGEARFRLITDQASDMIAVNDIQGRCIFMSPASRSVLGYEPAEMVGKTPRDFAPEADYPALAHFSERVRASTPGTVSSLRFRMRHANTDLRWMEVAARLAEYEGRPCVIAVARDVSEQVAFEDELREARAQAEAAAHSKSSFLANMSHEIRTPMNGVVGFTELLLAGDLDTEQRRQAELIADSSKAMMRLLNDILDLSKVEAGQMTVSNEPFDLVHALKACMKLIAPAAEQKGIALDCAFDPDLPKLITGDALRLRQVVLNLLGNAAKFTMEGTITLAASIRDGTALSIEVRDTGIGIAADRREAIFEQFVQADGGIAPRFGGTGLGLAISSQLARLMGGELTLDSEVGVGTCFTLRLPLLTLTTAQAASDPEERREAAAVGSGSMRILVAEDHDVNQALISAMLAKLGCNVDLAINGREAVAMVDTAHAQDRPYALVFMDMQMPEMGGIEATRAIRDAGWDEQTLPIVALTANAYADDVEACLAAGMQAHVSKPFSLHALETAIRQWLPAPPLTKPVGAARFSAQLQDRYTDRKRETLERLDALVRAGTFEDRELSEVATLLHKLGGTAAMFGDVTLGVEAKALETGLAQWKATEREDKIVRAVEAIQRAA